MGFTIVYFSCSFCAGGADHSGRSKHDALLAIRQPPLILAVRRRPSPIRKIRWPRLQDCHPKYRHGGQGPARPRGHELKVSCSHQPSRGPAPLAVLNVPPSERLQKALSAPAPLGSEAVASETHPTGRRDGR